MTEEGIPWLTDPQRDFLAHLTVVTLLPQMQKLKPAAGYTYDNLREALAVIDGDGEVSLRGRRRKRVGRHLRPSHHPRRPRLAGIHGAPVGRRSQQLVRAA